MKKILLMMLVLAGCSTPRPSTVPESYSQCVRPQLLGNWVCCYRGEEKTCRKVATYEMSRP